MTMRVLWLIPDDPEYAPAPDRLAALEDALAELLPGPDFLGVTLAEAPEFIDAGVYETGVRCPRCGATLHDGGDEESWWTAAMDRAERPDGRFGRLDTLTSCCGLRISLGDLDYAGRAGFARFHVTTGVGGVAHTPLPLDRDTMEGLAKAAGCELRQIVTCPEPALGLRAGPGASRGGR